MKAVVAAVFALLVSGCAIGNQHQYAGVVPNISVQTNRSLAVAVQDRRPYILDGSKSEDFVGVQRGGFGNPFDVTTTTDGPLAVDIRDSVATSFKNKGVQVAPITVRPRQPPADVVQALIQAGKDRALLITLNEWKSDTFMNTALIYDATAQVLDGDGRILASSHVRGRDDLSGSGINPPAHAKAAIPTAFRGKFEQLLNDPQVAAALW
jgi:hypothetical protein